MDQSTVNELQMSQALFEIELPILIKKLKKKDFKPQNTQIFISYLQLRGHDCNNCNISE